MSRSRFAQTLLDVLDDVAIRRIPANSPQDEVYQLRYRAYRFEDFIQPNAQERVFDQHDIAPNVNCFGIYLKERLVSSVRLHHVTPKQTISPSRVVFPKELTQLLKSGKSYIDPSRFTTDYEMRMQFPALPFITLRVVAMACEHFQTDFCVSAVRPEHAAFYRRVFGSKKTEGAIGYYPGIDFEMQLYTAAVSEIRNRVAVRFPFFMSTAEERHTLFETDGGVGLHHLVKSTAKQAQEDQNEKPTE